MNLVKQALIYKIAKEQEEKKSWAKRHKTKLKIAGGLAMTAAGLYGAKKFADIAKASAKAESLIKHTGSKKPSETPTKAAVEKVKDYFAKGSAHRVEKNKNEIKRVFSLVGDVKAKLLGERVIGARPSPDYKKVMKPYEKLKGNLANMSRHPFSV